MRTLHHAAAFVLATLLACTDRSDKPDTEEPDISTVRRLEGEELARRGEYLVTIASCGDCHSPKIMNPQGPPIEDSTRRFSGHPAGQAMPPVFTEALRPGQWALMSQTGTAFAGPWGISYTANLTPDSATGIGAWSEEVFIKTLRTGKHLGQENGRPILPPMPWYYVNKMTDEDLRAVYAYLRSLPPVNNRVPAPVGPEEAMRQ